MSYSRLKVDFFPSLLVAACSLCLMGCACDAVLHRRSASQTETSQPDPIVELRNLLLQLRQASGADEQHRLARQLVASKANWVRLRPDIANMHITPLDESDMVVKWKDYSNIALVRKIFVADPWTKPPVTEPVLITLHSPLVAGVLREWEGHIE